MQLLFSLDQDMKVEKTLIQTLASQLLSTHVRLLFSLDQDIRIEKTFIQTLTCQLPLLPSTIMQLLFSFDQDTRVEKTLIQTLQLSLTLTQLKLIIFVDKNLVPYPTCLHSSFLLSLHGPQAVCTCAPIYTVLYWLTGPHTWFSSN